jgi:hypothetical protein
MFYPTVKEYRPIRFKGYDIFLELKLNGVMVASCYMMMDKILLSHLWIIKKMK